MVADTFWVWHAVVDPAGPRRGLQIAQEMQERQRRVRHGGGWSWTIAAPCKQIDEFFGAGFCGGGNFGRAIVAFYPS